MENLQFRLQKVSPLKSARVTLKQNPFDPSWSEETYRQWLRNIFEPSFDQNENGYLSNYEVLDFFKYHTYNLPPDKILNLKKELAKNVDGSINYKEFELIMRHNYITDLPKIKQLMLNIAVLTNPAHSKRVIQSGILSEDRIDGVLTKGDKEEIPVPYTTIYNCCPPPIFIPIVIIAIIIAFIIYALEIQERSRKEPNNNLTFTTGVPYWSPLIYDPRRRYEAWRFVSYMLIHQGYFHVIFNLVVIIILGITLEISEKAHRLMAVWLAGVIYGSLASSVCDPKALLAGASGGAYALMGAHFSIIMLNWPELQSHWKDCMGYPLQVALSGVVRVVCLSATLLVDLAVAIYRRFGLQDTPTVTIVAHVAGLLAGFLSGLCVVVSVTEAKWEKIARFVSLGVLLIFLFFAILWNGFYPGFPLQEFN